MKKWSRRKFLEAGVVGSIAMGGAGAVRLPAAQPVAPGEGGTSKAEFTPAAPETEQRELLRSAMDEIIPAGDGMPSASEAGGVDYLEKLSGHDAKVAKELRESLAALEDLSHKRFQTSFPSLSHDQRVEALTALEKQGGETFKTLRDYIYEAYYEQPQVWKLVGYDCYPTNGGGPTMKPFDEAILTEVRKKPKYYREV